MKLSLSLIACCWLFSPSLHAQDKQASPDSETSSKAYTIDLFVDTKTKQIYSEPGEGRVRMGSFEKVSDTPRKPATSTASGEVPAAGKEGGVLLRDVPTKPTEVAAKPGGFGFANWKEKDPFKYNLNGDGSQYIKFGLLNQIQGRYEQNNPGSLIQGQPVDDTTDVGLRRTRLVLQGQLTDRVYFYTQYGINNFNFLSQQNDNRHIAAMPYFHDAFAELRLTQGHQMIAGGGLSMANGLSRFSSPSVSTIMTLDVPIAGQYSTERTQLFNRQLGVWLRGQISKFRYRIAAQDSFPITTDGLANGAISPTISDFAQVGHKKQYGGMFYWNFWDTEPMTNDYMQGTYLGKKDILNLEAGFITEKNAMWTGTSPANAQYHDMTHWSVAGYLDAAVDKVKETAVSAYIGYFVYDYGPNYIRNNGNGQNSANGVGAMGSFNGAGNTYPMFGTGEMWYAQVGYLLPKDLIPGNNGQLQLYASLTSANWKRLHDQMNVFNGGINWLLKGHNSKITFDYQNRPIFNANAAGDIVKTSSRGQFVLQYQVAF
jgi:hypothetical protein